MHQRRPMTRHSGARPRHDHAVAVTIRAMTRADLDAVTALDTAINGHERRAYLASRLTTPDVSDAPGDAEPTSRRAILLVAEREHELAGFVMGTLAHGEFGLPHVTALVDSIAVQPALRGQDIGKRLMAEFVAVARRQGAETAWTLVTWNEWPLLRFFTSLGFAVGETIPLELPIAGDEHAGAGRTKRGGA